MPLLWGWSLGWGRNRMPLLRTSGRCDIPACHPVPSSPGWAGMVFISWGCCELNCFEPWSAIMKVGGCFDSWCSGSILVRQAWRHAFKFVPNQSSGAQKKTGNISSYLFANRLACISCHSISLLRCLHCNGWVKSYLKLQVVCLAYLTRQRKGLACKGWWKQVLMLPSLVWNMRTPVFAA